MANILTIDEAARAVSVDVSDDKLFDVLPQVDAYIIQATGWDWSKDTEINPTAKSAARLYLALTYDMMAMQQNQIDALNRALVSNLSQLESITIGNKAIVNVNSCQFKEDLRPLLETEALGLNLSAYYRLNSGARWEVVKSVYDSRPSNGYADLPVIQTSLDNKIKTFL